METELAGWKKRFFLIWGGQAFSLIGSQLVHFAIAWWVTQATGSAAVLTTMAIFGMLPHVLLGPFIGALVDRWNRRLVMIASDSVIALITLGLALLFLTGRIEYWHLYATALIRGTLGAFHFTAMQASTSLLVPREQLSRIAGLNQTLMGVLNIAAPPLGAMVVSLLPMGQIMLIDVVTAALAVVPLLFLHVPQPANASTEAVTPRAVLADVVAGLRFMRAWPGMMVILGMATLVNFFLTPTGTLTPLLIFRHFDGGPWHLGAMNSSWWVGVVAGGLLLSVWGGFRRRVVTSMTFLALMGIGVLIVGFTPGDMFWLALVGNALSGAMNPMVNGPLMAMLQERIPHEMQGRVFTLVGSLAAAISPLGLALAAPVADNLGIQVWWWIGGAFCLVAGTLMFLVPAVMNIENEQPPAIGAQPAVPGLEPAAD